MKISSFGIIALILFALVIGLTCTVYADSGVNATPEVQGITTGTSSSVQGTVTETDSGAWTTTYDPSSEQFYNLIPASGSSIGFTAYNSLSDAQNALNAQTNQLTSAGGSWNAIVISYPGVQYNSMNIPASLLNTPIADPIIPGETWGQLEQDLQSAGILTVTGGSSGGIHSGALDPGQVQYTTGYNDQYSGVSGQQTFAKSMALSTANQIATGSNIKANTNIQYIAIDTGRATRSEDLLLDGAGNSTSTANSILCPFAQSVSAVIPPYCNIVQAGSAFDTTLTSTVTSANDRFVGTDSTFPVVLNYNINSEGLTIGNQTSPMIGSVSAYLKVHVQEARNATPTKSEDLAYTETSTASGLISGFSKSMSYQSGFNLI